MIVSDGRSGPFRRRPLSINNSHLAEKMVRQAFAGTRFFAIRTRVREVQEVQEA
jgi:hypothetical protein